MLKICQSISYLWQPIRTLFIRKNIYCILFRFVVPLVNYFGTSHSWILNQFKGLRFKKALNIDY